MTRPTLCIGAPGKIKCGTWLTLGSPIVAELCAELGFDWLVLDLEHGLVGEESVIPVLQAVRGTSTAVIVRVPSAEPTAIGRVLDRGAHGVMIPHVTDADKAKECVAAIRYPPLGKRGFSSSSRAFAYGLEAPPLAKGASAPIFLAQIESLEGVLAAEAIAKVDGVDGLFIGPSDLKLDLSITTDPRSLPFEEAVSAVISAARSAQKVAGILVRASHDAEKLISSGLSLVAFDSDLAILRSGYQALMRHPAITKEN